MQKKSDAERAKQAQKSLMSWYLAHARPLPWRSKPSLYGIWLSEIMLQQTRMETGVPKWKAFIATFPTVEALALADEESVLKAWEGLGYYRRARLLHDAAKAIHRRGSFPQSHREWLQLPGVGPYTAAAIASIGLGEAVAAVDGNVQRVASRWDGIDLPVDSRAGSSAVQTVADAWLDHDRPGDHNQAVMELGALVCKPQNPQCHDCPLSSTCAASGQKDLWSKLPVKKPKKPPISWNLEWHVVTWDNFVVVHLRPESGVWAKMWTFPEKPPQEGMDHLGDLFDPVTHILSHRRISASFHGWQAPDKSALQAYASSVASRVVSWEEFRALPRPRLLTKMWSELTRVFQKSN